MSTPLTNVRRGFSLIELLVVISIIAILASILMPVIAMVRGAARSTVCMSGMRQIGMSFGAYASEWDGMYPGKNSATFYAGTPYRQWFGALLVYLDNDSYKGGQSVSSKAYMCPDGLYPRRSLDGWGLNFGYNALYPFSIESYSANSIARGSSLYLILERTGRQLGGGADNNWDVQAPWVSPAWLPGQPHLWPGQQRISHRGRSNCLFSDILTRKGTHLR